MKFGSIVIKVRPALTKLSGTRNYSLKKACDMLKEGGQGRDVQIGMKVDGRLSFEQSRDDASGRFTGDHASMKLP